MSNKYNRKDHLYDRAKAEGFRARSAYKLLELNSKYELIEPGCKVLDLGAWPGGWLQVAAAAAKNNGVVVGIDLTQIEDFDAANIKLITGDVRDETNLMQALELAGGRFDLVLSDMSAKLTGIREADAAASVGCAELALWVAQRLLIPGGNLVIKVFKSGDIEAFVKTIRSVFNKVVRTELDSTRKSSNEFYLVCLGLKSALNL